MKRLTIAFFLLASCRPDTPPTEYVYTDIQNLNPKDLIGLSPEGYYYKVPIVKEPVAMLSPWEHSPSWYRSLKGYRDVRVVYADDSHPDFPDIITTCDSIRYYDSLVGYPSRTIIPAQGALSDK